MRNSVLFAFLLIIGLALSYPAYASEPTTDGASADNGPAVPPEGPSLSGYLGVASSYIYQDFGIFASRNPTVYGGLTSSWKSGDAVDIWTSQGAGDAADEIDLSYWHNGSFDSFVGPIAYQAKVAYYFLSGGRNRLFTPVDDALYAHLDLGRTFNLGNATVGLHSKTEVIEGLNNLPFFLVERVGLPADFKITGTVSGEIEVAHAWNLTGNGHNPWELTPKLAWNIGGGTLVAQDKMAETNRHVIHEVMLEFDIPLN